MKKILNNTTTVKVNKGIEDNIKQNSQNNLESKLKENSIESRLKKEEPIKHSMPLDTAKMEEIRYRIESYKDFRVGSLIRLYRIKIRRGKYAIL